MSTNTWVDECSDILRTTCCAWFFRVMEVCAMQTSNASNSLDIGNWASGKKFLEVPVGPVGVGYLVSQCYRWDIRYSEFRICIFSEISYVGIHNNYISNIMMKSCFFTSVACFQVVYVVPGEVSKPHNSSCELDGYISWTLICEIEIQIRNSEFR